MKLGHGLGADFVVAASSAIPMAHVWNISGDGFAKTTPIEQYKTQLRDGSGVLSMRLDGENREVADAVVGRLEESVLVLTNRNKTKFMRLRDAEAIERRPDGGKRVIDLREGEAVIAAVVYQKRIDAAEISDAQRALPEDAALGRRQAQSGSSDNGAGIDSGLTDES